MLAAQTGFAGLVQAGYLMSSILCISRHHFSRIKSPYPQIVSTRFSHRTGLPVNCKTRQCPRHARSWLGFPYILGCRWVPTGSPRAIRYVGCYGWDYWFNHWEENYCHGASSDGGRLVIFVLDRHGRRINFAMCLYSLTLRCRPCCCPYFYRKRVGGRWPCVHASRMNLTGVFLITRLLISMFSSLSLPISASSSVE